MTYHFFSLMVLLVVVIVVCVLPILAYCISPKYRRKLHRAYVMRDRNYPYFLPTPVPMPKTEGIPYLLLPYPAELSLDEGLAKRNSACKRYDAKNAAHRNMYPNRGRGRKTFNRTGKK